jgi:glycosyltransferase involved in cell wall biosynthesis
LKVAIYNRFLPSMGGGERHSCMLAQVLAEEGHDVELIAHDDVGKEILGDHLGLDLKKVNLQIVPDKGDDQLAGLSTAYDLFVNASYMSRVKPRARHNLYLCYFPTPFDHDLSPLRRRLARTLGRQVRRGKPDLVGWGEGWFPPEGGRRRTWAWTSGHAVLRLPAGEGRRIVFDLGRPGAPESAELVLRDEHGDQLAKLTADPSGFEHHEISLPPDLHEHEVVFDSRTFVPGEGDPRTLGVAVSRLHMAGARRDLRRMLGERFPWMLRNPDDLTFLDHYQRVLANSEYTRGWIKQYWNVDSDVLFPPIRVPDQPPSPAAKTRRILTVGRFFPPGMGHSKKQLEQVQAFGKMIRSGALDGWELHLAGGCRPAQRPYLDKVRRAAEGLPVHIHANAPRDLVDELFATSSIFWSATGLGEDERTRPWVFEHFGITTAEAMASGCVPVVIDKAGQREIVRHGIDGYRWSTLEELETYSRVLAADRALRERLATAATARAQEFSETAFASRWAELEDRLGLI